MNPALLGIASAVAWGGADFTARFTSRSLGHINSLFGTLAVGAIVLSIWIVASATPVVWPAADSAWLLLVTGIAVMGGTLLLYEALARGPLGVVAPIAGGYPAIVVVFAVVAGVRPTGTQWAAMAAVMAGVFIVGRAGHAAEPSDASAAPGGLRWTLALSAGAATLLAFGVSAGQAVAPAFGELQTLWCSRWIGLLALLPLYLSPRFAFKLSARWSPALLLQGLLDAGAYLALFAAGRGEGAEIAAVIGSAFGAVTALLARVVLKETISWGQWGGIALIFGGVAALSGFK